MTDDEVGDLLDSSKPLVVIEAPAGCGKTYQGATHAKRAAESLTRGRALILTHTHAACAVFAKETKAARQHVEIRTIDSLLVQIAAAYHKSLGLSADPSTWARQQGENGFQKLAKVVAGFVKQHPMIAGALSDRYPLVIADEHQDSTTDQHDVVMALQAAGSRLRIFGDPMQRIYGSKHSDAAIAADRARWEKLKSAGVPGQLCYPHRWKDGSLELGTWILQARERLKAKQPIDLTQHRPPGLRVLFAENIAQARSVYSLCPADRKPIDSVVSAAQGILVLASHTDTVQALRAFWGRRVPIWEGHSREPLGSLVATLVEAGGNCEAVAGAVVQFLESLCVGFSRSSHGDRFTAEVAARCAKATSGKPASIQALARCIVENPTHIGVANCLQRLMELVETRVNGFDCIHIDYRNEYRDAIRLGDFDNAAEGLAQIHQKRSFARPMPPRKAISTIHKAKGLECENVLVMPCDAKHFGSTDYARCKLYVALSRAITSLTLVVSKNAPSSLLKVH